MSYSPLLLLHICTGTLGMLSGFVTVFLRKGSRAHGLAGQVFVITMLTMSATGAYMALMKSQPSNVLGGALTFYLVATAWMTARRRESGTDMFDWGALLVVFEVAAVEVTYGFEAAISPTGLKYGYPAGPYFFLGFVALLATAGDVRMLVRGGISGAQRLARHLWRMCFALFIAAASIFLARQQVFPAVLRKAGVLVFLSVLPLLLMIFWLVRVRFTKTHKKPAAPYRTQEDRLEFRKQVLVPMLLLAVCLPVVLSGRAHAQGRTAGDQIQIRTEAQTREARLLVRAKKSYYR